MQAAGWGSEGDPRGTYAGAFHSEGSGAGTLGKALAAAGRPHWTAVPSHPVPDPGRRQAAGRPVPRPAPASRAASGAPGCLRVRPGPRGQGRGLRAAGARSRGVLRALPAPSLRLPAASGASVGRQIQQKNAQIGTPKKRMSTIARGILPLKKFSFFI